jgi:hypothetical protein
MNLRQQYPNRMFVWRVIAAIRRSALLARPQVDPLGADFDGVLAFPVFWMFNGSDSADMGARCVGHRPPLLPVQLQST